MLVRKTVTALFCDVADSTGLGERLDPESHRRVITRYFEEMQATIERHGGTVEKFVGDAVMALFGVPVVHEDDPLRAVRSAVEMRERLEVLNAELERDYELRLQICIGVNTGEVVTGGETIGGTLATGDAITVAARLQQAAEPGEILIGTSTYPLVKDAVRAGPRRTYKLKGKRHDVQTWQLESVSAGAAGIARRLDAPLVDREHELGRMHEAFDSAVANTRCELLTVLGHAGIGKSRLAGELLSQLGERASGLTGRCLPYGDGITFWPVLELVRQLGGAGQLETILAGAQDAERIAARVRGAIGAGPAGGPPEETSWAVRRLLEALASRRPLVVCLEDIHWAQPTLLDLVEYLVGWSRESPILLLCLARPELLEERPTWLSPRANARALLLERLAPTDADALVNQLASEAELDTSLRERIAAAAEGNPLFVEQMVAMAAEEGDRPGTGLVPPSIQALLAERLDRLTPNERAVIERAAIVGREFPQSAVIELCPPDLRASAGAELLSLVRKGLIAPGAAPGSHIEDGFRFRHILIRDGAYDAMPREVRAELHEQFAAWFEHVAGDRVAQFEEIIGYHLEQAYTARAALGPADEHARRLALRGAERLRSAGLRAYSRGDLPAAVNLLTRATVLLVNDDEVRITVAPELAYALMETGELRAADGVLTSAIEVARTLGDRRSEARALAGRTLLQIHLDPHAWENALPSAKRAIDVMSELRDDAGLARAWTDVLLVHYTHGHVEEMEQAAGRAFHHASLAGDERQISTVLNARIRAALVGPLPAAEAIERCEALAGELAADGSLRAVALAARAYLEAMTGRFEPARALYCSSRALLEELGRSRLIAALSAYAAAIELLAGDAVAAERELRAGIDTLREIGDQGNLATHEALLAQALLEQGREHEARECTERSERAAAPNDVFSQLGWRTARARLEAVNGSPAAAKRIALEAVGLAKGTDCPELQGDAAFALGSVLLVLGARDDASEAFAAAVEHYEAKGNSIRAAASQAALDDAAAQPA